MGVPGLYRWLVQRYPLIRRRADDFCRPKFTHFYIDFNCIIYNSLMLVNVVGDDYDELFHEICRFLDTIVQLIRPENLIYIAVDGPAPFAKCTQQRSRRFYSSRDHKPDHFDKTMISVGTDFMEQLNDFLKMYLKNKTLNDPIWKKPQIIYSSHRVPGEGEHKFLEYLREQKKMGLMSKDMVHCVFSPDADMIFLSLQTREPNFYILKEFYSWVGPYENVGNAKLNKLRSNGNDFELLSISLLREYFKLDFHEIEDIDRLIDEFATFSFLLGNDFIPHFPDVMMYDGDFGLIVRVYQNVMMKKHLYLVEDGKINKTNLKIFLENIIKAFSEKPEPSNAKRSYQTSEFDFKKKNESSRYMAKKFPDEYNKAPNSFEQKISESVLNSFDWVLEYYTNGCCSWTWFYDYFYAPPLSIVVKYCEGHKSHFELDRPPFPFEQLLCILPPQNSYLLPEPIGKLMHEPSEISCYYPETFKVDLNGRRNESEGVILIPHINLVEIRKEFDNVKSQLSSSDLVRNELENIYLVSNGELKVYDPQNDKIDEIQSDFRIKPSFYNIPIKFKSDNSKILPVFLFTRKSAEVSVSITPCIKNLPNNVEDVESIKHTIVFVNWPYTSPAYVSNVIRFNSKEIVKIQNEYKEKYGIYLIDNNIILEVHMLKSSNISGTKYLFQTNSCYVPFQLSYPIESEKYLNMLKYNVNVDNILSNGTNVIYKDNDTYKVGNVISLEEDMVNLSVKSLKVLDKIDAILEKEDDEWVDISYLESKLKINENILLDFLSSLKCDNQLFIAFTAFYKNDRKTLYEGVLEGSCKKCFDDEYLFTKEFCSKFIEFMDDPTIKQIVNYLSVPRPDCDFIQVRSRQLWGKEPSTRVLAYFENYFSKDAYCGKFFLIDKNIDIISQRSLEKIEDLLVSKENKPTEYMIKIPLSSIVFRPGQLKKKMDNFSIGSRVIFIGNSGPIPFGSIGTIIGIDQPNFQYHIILDDEYEYAHNLRKRLKTRRGYIAFSDDLLPTK